MYKLSEIAQKYKEKLVTADEAVKCIKSGDYVHFGVFNGIVYDLDKALAKRAEELHDVKIVVTIRAYPGTAAVLEADPDSKHFKYLSTHFSVSDRQMNKEGRCWTIPVLFGENNISWPNNVEAIDVAMLQVAPMDRHGNFNLGPQVADYLGIFKIAKKIIVEVNENMPVVHGMQTSINISEVDMIVEGSNVAMPIIKAKEATEIDKQIGRLVVERISSGSTLQLGVGGLPNYIGSLMLESDINDLGVHSEMYVDAYYKLFCEGKVTGNKNINTGKMLCTFAQGSEELYDFVNDNPLVCFAPVGYVNAKHVISANDKMVSINSCLQVDLFSQVNSESAGLQHIGGTGGQLDFVQGAFHSKDGQSFLCTPSVRKNKDGELESLIMPTLPQGSIVTVPRAAVQHIVTEYGIINVKQKSTWERAELLISIAHPDFREDLIKEAERMGIWTKSSKILV